MTTKDTIRLPMRALQKYTMNHTPVRGERVCVSIDSVCVLASLGLSY